MKRFLKEGISHLSVIFATMLLTFWVTDRFNTAMAFVNHPMTKGLFGLFALSMAAVAVFLITDRTSALCPLRMGTGILTLLTAVGLGVLLVVDHHNPRLLLFVSDGVKFALLGAILTGLFAAILGICCRERQYRAAWKQTIPPKEPTK